MLLTLSTHNTQLQQNTSPYTTPDTHMINICCTQTFKAAGHSLKVLWLKTYTHGLCFSMGSTVQPEL